MFCPDEPEERITTEHLAAGLNAVITALPGWCVHYDSFNRVWRVMPPSFKVHGVTVEGTTPEIVIARAQIAVARWPELEVPRG